MSDTPRTDKQAIANSLNGRIMADEVPADFARELERENTRFLEFVESVRRINNAPIDASDAMDEIDALMDLFPSA